MIILTGASASGKTEIALFLVRKYGFEKVITYTTRPMRIHEKQDVDYHFISQEEFLRKKEHHDFLETMSYHDYHYGTAYEDVQGKKVLVVDPVGANVYYEYLKEKAVFFLIETKEEIRKKRMKDRKDKEEDINKRIYGDRISFHPSKMKHIDFIVQNNEESLEDVAKQVYTLYRSKIHDI